MSHLNFAAVHPLKAATTNFKCQNKSRETAGSLIVRSRNLPSFERKSRQTAKKMASTRSRRANAGNKIAKLLDEEEEDDFYKTSYGGFQEVDDDVDYV